MKLSNTTKSIIAICSILIILSFGFSHSKEGFMSQDITTLTDNWIKAVTVEHNPEAISKLFCPDGNLVGTVSQIKRQGKDIKRYFEFFSKLPGIRVVKRQYNISKITNNVYLNTAFVTWMWDGLEKPIIARMTFIFRGKCIFQLHSSALPEVNEDLYKISYKK